MATFEITEVEANPREWEARRGPAAGQKFLSYTVQAKGPDGEVGRYEISRRPESQPPALGPDDYMVEPAPFDGALSKLKKSGGNFNAPKYERVPDNSDRSRRIERQHSQEMALRAITLLGGPALREMFGGQSRPIDLRELTKEWTDHFQQDLDADLGGGNGTDAPLAPAADVSAEAGGDDRRVAQGDPVRITPDLSAYNMQAAPVEASPAQKGKLTQLFGKAGLSRDAMKAVVLFRCRSEKATKNGASKLIQDLMDGATHDTLIAEISDAHRSGNDPVATRALKLIPSEVPLAPEPVEVVPPNGEDKVPF